MIKHIKTIFLGIILLVSVGLIINSNKINVFAADMGVSNFKVGDIVTTSDMLELWFGDGFCVSDYTSCDNTSCPQLYDDCTDSYYYDPTCDPTNPDNSDNSCELKYEQLFITYYNEEMFVDYTDSYNLQDMYDSYINCGVTPKISLSNNCYTSEWKILKMYETSSSDYKIELRPAHLNFKINTNNNDNEGTITFEDASIDLNSVEEDSYVNFSINPKIGYELKSLEITKNDGENTPVIYAYNNGNYSFKMPDSDITIKPIYEKSKYSINVEIVDETKELNINVYDMTQLEYNEEVTFKVTPIKGYQINSLRIIDENNNEIEYTTTDNKNYLFTMPNSNVTIIPSYERVKNAVTMDDNKNTKEFSIEVNDTSAVVYEDTVVFKVSPEEGYEVDKIEIIDKDNNRIDYRKTNNINEYVFIMPDTDVVIKPTYRKISINKPSTGINPNTGNILLLTILLISIILVIGTYLYKKKRV